MTIEKMEMRALIYHGIQDVRVETCPIPECGPDDVIVRTMRAAICGSDMTAYLHGGENMYILPGHEFGHEMVGYVWKKGAQVTGVQEGDRVFVEPAQAVENPMEANMAGAFSQYMRVHHACEGKNLYLLPENLSYDDAVITEPLSVSTHAKNRAATKPEDKVLVCGSGPIGLGVAAALLAQGNKTVAVVDRDAHRLNYAEAMGAFPILSMDNDLEHLKDQLVPFFGLMENMNHRVHFGEAGGDVEITPNPVLDVDVVFDCVGIPSFADEFIRHAKQYARFCDIAVHRTETSIRFHEIMSTQCALMGSRGYEHEDIVEVIQNLVQGKIRAEQMVTHCFPLEQATEAFATAADSAKAVKVVLNME